MAPRQIADYVKVYDQMLRPDECQVLIGRFESSEGQRESQKLDIGAESIYRFDTLNLTACWPEVDSQIWPVIRNCFYHYRDKLGLQRYWPTNASVEPIRLKRYLPDGGDHFDLHVDVLNRSNSDRFVSAILYLNEPGGGETIFPEIGVTVQPKPGRVVVFPPHWTFVHAGLPPRDRPKYIIHTYLLYPAPPNAVATPPPQAQ